MASTCAPTSSAPATPDAVDAHASAAAFEKLPVLPRLRSMTVVAPSSTTVIGPIARYSEPEPLYISLKVGSGSPAEARLATIHRGKLSSISAALAMVTMPARRARSTSERSSMRRFGARRRPNKAERGKSQN
eukprot:scaffold8780_cov130-Isochrysis_galbana.AAC.8